MSSQPIGKKTYAKTNAKTYAEWFTQQGYAIFPIDPESKKPVVKDWQKYSHEPLTEEEKIRYLETIEKGYNYAVPGGQKGLVILDIEDSTILKAWLGEQEIDGICKKTLCVETPHGGLHIYFTSPEIPPHKFNPAFIKDGKTVMDLQSYNSYVVGPASCINHVHCTSEKCPWKGQDHETCYMLIGNDRIERISTVEDLKGLLKGLAEKGGKIGVSMAPNTRAWVFGTRSEKTETEGDLEKDLKRLEKELAKYNRYDGKTADAVRKEVCQSVKRNMDNAKSDRAKATLSTAYATVCQGKSYEELGIDRSRGDWRVFKVLLSHGVTDLEILQQLLPQDSKVFAPKWDLYLIHTLKKAWKDVKPYLKIMRNSKGKKIKEIKAELTETLSRKIIEKYHVVTFFQRHTNGESVIGIFRWNRRKGVYEPIDETLKLIIRNEIMGILESLPSFEEDEGEHMFYQVGIELVKVVYEEIRDLTLTEYEDDEIPLRVAFPNCTVEWSTDRGKPIPRLYTAEERSENEYAFHYVPHSIRGELLMREKVPEVPELEEIARHVCPQTLETFKKWAGNKWITLFEIIGYTLYPATKLKLAFMLLGPRDSGKSSFLQLLKKVLGKQNTVSIRIKELFDSNNRFVMGYLFHKLANLTAETKEYSIDDIDRFKTLTGGDQVTSDVKFKGPITFTPYAKIIVGSNKLPNVSDRNDMAFWRRWLIVEFPNQFQNDDTWFYRTFTEEEIQGILTVSILAFARVFMRGEFDYQQSPEEVKDLWLNNIDSVWSFVKTYTERGVITVSPRNADLWVTRKDLYNLYRNYCMDHGFTGVSMRVFASKLHKYFGITSMYKYFGKDEEGNEIRKRCFVGISMDKGTKKTTEIATVNDLNEFVEYIKKNHHVVKEFWEVVQDFGNNRQKANKFVTWCEQRGMCDQKGIDVWEIHL